MQKLAHNESNKPLFNKALFWDVNYQVIDFDKHARFVIERVISRGNTRDWKELKQYYGLTKIKDEVVHIRYLDKITFNFCHTFFLQAGTALALQLGHRISIDIDCVQSKKNYFRQNQTNLSR